MPDTNSLTPDQMPGKPASHQAPNCQSLRLQEISKKGKKCHNLIFIVLRVRFKRASCAYKRVRRIYSLLYSFRDNTLQHDSWHKWINTFNPSDEYTRHLQMAYLCKKSLSYANSIDPDQSTPKLGEYMQCACRMQTVQILVRAS